MNAMGLVPTRTPSAIPTDTLPPGPTNTPAPTNTLAPTETPVPSETPDPNLVKPGTYLVNTDIQPGIYRGQAGTDLPSSCYWQRMKDLTGGVDSVLANDNSVGQFYVEILSTDHAFETRCEITRLDPIPEHTGEYPTRIPLGTYLIGYDIRAGTYKGEGGSDVLSSCYWARLQSVAGGLDGILGNDNATGQFYVQVLPGDFALITGCELEWVGE
jgi:hypothetical protein